MEQLLKQAIARSKDSKDPSVLLFFEGRYFLLSGKWSWELRSDALFCTEVIQPQPEGFEGSYGLLHPEDHAAINDLLNNQEKSEISFRIISSYGSIHPVSGHDITITELNELQPVSTILLQKETSNYLLERQLELSGWERRARQIAERNGRSGSWCLHTGTHDMYYSDGMFRLHGLPAQSLNAHYHTFWPFIHPDDRNAVTESFSNALAELRPLHLQYRVQTPDGRIVILLQMIHWEHDANGNMMGYGFVQDLTGQTAIEERQEEADWMVSFHKRQLLFSEQSAPIAYWHLNLLTRKASFSDNYYRIHGLKPGSLQGGLPKFLNYVHPEDRAMVQDMNDKIRDQQLPPDLEFRIVRPDGKLRYVRQRGKLLTNGDKELIMSGTLMDITAERLNEKKLSQLREQVSVQSFANHQIEEMAGVGSWHWDLQTGHMSWSDSLCKMFGQKPGTTGLSQKQLLRGVHPEDRKLFTDEMNRAVSERKESEFGFRLIRAGRLLYMRASFKLMIHDGKELFIGMIQDKSQQQKMEEQLSERINLAESLAENIKDRVFITDDNNNIVLWNRQCEEAYGLRRDQVLQKNFFDVLPFLKEEATIDRFSKALNGAPILLAAQQMEGGYFDLFLLPLQESGGKVTGILHVLHDVTREREMQYHLSERLHFIESLVEASVDRIIVMDRQMNYLYCNSRAADYFNLRKEDIIGKNVLEVFPTSVNNPSFEHFRRALKGETVHIPAIESLIEDHYYQLYLVPIMNDQNEVTAVLWLHHDLSHQIRLQRQLKKADDLLNNIQEIYIELDNEACIRYLNEQALRLTGNGLSDPLGKNIWALLPAERSTAAYGLINQALREKVAVSGEFLSAITNRWTWLSVTPLPDGIIILFNDVHEVRSTRDRLQENEAQLREAELLGHTGSYSGDLNSSILRFSDGLFRIFGYEPQSFVPDLAFMEAASHPDDRPLAAAIVEQARRDRRPYEYHLRIFRKDGSMRYLYVQGKIICNEEGVPIRFLEMVKDITDWALQEAERIEGHILLKRTTQVSPDAIIVYDILNQVPRYLNDNLANWTGFSSGELINMKPEGRLALIHEEDREAWINFNWNSAQARGDEVRTLSYRIRGGDGVWRWVRDRTRVFSRNETGDPTQLLTVLQDLTEQKETEQKLEEQAHFICQVTLASPDHILVYDLERQGLVNVNGHPFPGVRSLQADDEMNEERAISFAHIDDRKLLYDFIFSFRRATDQETRSLEYRVSVERGIAWQKATGKVFRRNEHGVVSQVILVVQDINKEGEHGHGKL